MFKKYFYTAAILGCSLWVSGCGNAEQQAQQTEMPADSLQTVKSLAAQELEKYVTVKLTADLSKLSENEKKMIPLLLDAAKLMDDIFWKEAYGDKNTFLAEISDPDEKRFAEINYGPWDRLNGNKPFIAKYGEKPKGANFYPADITKEEFEAFKDKDKAGQYSVIRRNADGSLKTVPYRVEFKEEVEKAAELLKQAAALAEDAGLKKYLELRAQALLTDKYYESDIAWMDMKTNGLDMVIGPIENYEDQLYSYRSTHEAYLLVKDKEWSAKLSKFAAMLPELQKGIPVDEKYKKEKPGTDSDLNAYDVVYYAGDCNSGSKTIAINLPNDAAVQLKKGTRRLQLKNAMKAKFDAILVPLANVLIDESQRKHIAFDAFFANVMFHEVAHGLGIKKTINGKGLVTEALKERNSWLEEGKADILGLYMITELHKKGEIQGELMDYYTTFLASIFRSVRFGASSAHGKANTVCFNFFQEMGAFTYNAEKGTYLVNFDKMQTAMAALSGKILVLQGEGDYEGVGSLMDTKGKVSADLQKDLDKLRTANIPVDIVFEQGKEALGL